jgi:hypothetical protein
MKISKIHKKFANRLYPQDTLNHPGDYLGPNWEEVINFWLYLDTLTKDQLWVVEKHCLDLSNGELCIACNRAFNVAKGTTKYAYEASGAVYIGVFRVKIAAWATLELIGLQKLLEKSYKPLFFPMFHLNSPTPKTKLHPSNTSFQPRNTES